MEKTDPNRIVICFSNKEEDEKRATYEEIIKSLSKLSGSTIVSEDNNKIVIKINNANKTIESIVPKIKFVALNTQKPQKKGLFSRAFHQPNKGNKDGDNEKLVDISGFLVKV